MPGQVSSKRTFCSRVTARRTFASSRSTILPLEDGARPELLHHRELSVDHRAPALEQVPVRHALARPPQVFLEQEALETPGLPSRHLVREGQGGEPLPRPDRRLELPGLVDEQEQAVLGLAEDGILLGGQVHGSESSNCVRGRTTPPRGGHPSSGCGRSWSCRQTRSIAAGLCWIARGSRESPGGAGSSRMPPSRGSSDIGGTLAARDPGRPRWACRSRRRDPSTQSGNDKAGSQVSPAASRRFSSVSFLLCWARRSATLRCISSVRPARAGPRAGPPGAAPRNRTTSGRAWR